MGRFVGILLLLATLVWVSELTSHRAPAPRGAIPDVASDRDHTGLPRGDASADPDGVAAMQASIAGLEYQVSENSVGLQAPNRAHGLRTYFEPDGIRIVDRTADAAELLAMRLVRVGRAGSMEEVARGLVHHEDARVEIRREGVVEWYENSPAGLEQGFTLASRPPGEGEVVVELAVTGARLRAATDHARFDCEGGRSIAYEKLVVFDASLRRLAARMEGEDGTLRLVMNDANAVYPVTIDPLLTSTPDAQLGAFQTEAHFGQFVAGAGDVNGDGYGDVLVGAERYDAGEIDEGAVFLFLGSAAGIANNASPSTVIQSNQEQAFLARVAGAGDVNGDGYDDIIVGAHAYDLGQSEEGAAFVFLGSASGIPNGSPATASATLQSNLTGATFGISVAGAGDVNGDGYADVIVGAPDVSSDGAAYIFLGGPGGIANGSPATAATALVSSQDFASFGISVAGVGDVNGDGFSDVAVGASRYDVAQTSEGAAFVFHGSASGIPSGNQTSAASTVRSNQASAFLAPVAGAGDVNGDGYSDVIVVAPSYDAGETNEGAAFVLHGSATGIPSGIALSVAASAFFSDQASASVGSGAGVGDVNGDGYGDVLFGSTAYSSGQSGEGAAFLFLGSPSGIPNGNPPTSAAFLQTNQVSANVVAVAAAGDIDGDGYADVIIGSHLFDGTFTNEGRAFLYRGGALGIAHGNDLTAAATFQSDQTDAALGMSVAGAGDVNGDGFSDVIVGATFYDAGEFNEGAAFVFHGSATGVPSGTPGTAPAMLQSNASNSRFGESVAGAGDVDGDGYADVVVGASEYTNGQTREGGAWIFRGSPTGVASASIAAAATALEGDLSNGYAGGSVAAAGDVNGDGYGDVVVGAEHYGTGGSTFVFHGSAAGIASGSVAAQAASILTGAQSLAQFGVSVAGAGDVNGDGYADVIVGADSYEVAVNTEGAAFVFHGSAAGVASGTAAATAATTLTSGVAFARFGGCVASAGDVNGDGYADVIVGRLETGVRAHVFHGGASGVASGSAASASATTFNPHASLIDSKVAGAGDLNGDGYADVIVGGIDAVYLYAGSASGLSTSLPMAVLTQSQAASNLGFSVASAGDVNGDGFADVIAGAPFHDDGSVNEGKAMVFLGGRRNGRPSMARQVRADGSGLSVHAWGASHAPDRFRVSMNATDPDGRGRAKLEVEHCAPAVPFGAPSCTRVQSATWTDVGIGAAGTVLSHDVTVSPNALRRWRARVLRAPFSVIQVGVVPPPNPSHGPWRRLEGQRFEGDVRIIAPGVAVEPPISDRADFAFAPLVNPTRGRIVLEATLPASGPAELEAFDVTGRRRLAERLESAGPGHHTWSVDGGDWGSGIYVLRLTQKGRVATARVVLIH